MSPQRHMHGAGDPDEVFTNIPTEQALRQSEITAIRMLSDTVQQCVKSIDRMREDMREQRDTVLELKPLIAAIAELKADGVRMKGKIDDLESDRDKRAGALNLVGWLSKNAPWFMAILAAALAVIIKRKDLG